MAATWLKSLVRNALGRGGYLIVRPDEGARRYLDPSFQGSVPLPEGAREYLRAHNPRLRSLTRAYDELDIAATAHSQWQPGFLSKNLTMQWFRGDNAYVWQVRLLGAGARTLMYLTLLDVESRDQLGLLSKLGEDGAFGAYVFQYGDRSLVSRDLLDSVNEINYLERRIGLRSIKSLRVLDIGAGYGRLAERMSTALPNLAGYDCIDAIAVSTFLCEYYLRYRQVDETVRVVPLHEYQTLRDHYHLALNIHSFSECSLAAIRWWLGQLAERSVEWLLIVPNRPTDQLLSTESDGSHLNYLPDVLDAGYVRTDQRFCHESDELRELIGVDARFHLFRRRDSVSADEVVNHVDQ